MSSGKALQKQLHHARVEREKAVAARALAHQFSSFGPRQKWLTRVAALLHVGILGGFLVGGAWLVKLEAELAELRKEAAGIAAVVSSSNPSPER